ncbi:MAG TPA: ParB/RepB/Spo0J family partition protein [Candidatus Baltobacteraceae bacterium]|nr:ParB/RepB/Spo0J family partition protein [Candidatus Baltobacteraceae bacterium]
MSTAPKRGLGRGLGALLGDPSPLHTAAGANPAAPPVVDAIRQIPVDRIRPNPHQPRKTFDPQALDELKASIGEHGVLVPILVRERGDGYELIAGERRWRACAALGRSTVPAIVRTSDDRESLEVAIIENLQRENLNPLEEAAGIAELIDSHDFTQEQVAQRLGKSRPAVTNALRLLGLPEVIKALIAEGSLSAAHARAILAAPETQRIELAKRAAQLGISVRALERIINTINHPPVAGNVRAPQSAPEDREFEARLRQKFGAAVQLRRGASGGSIEIKYANETDLIRIAEILLEQ